MCCVVRSVPPPQFVVSVKSTIVPNVLTPTLVRPMLFVKYNTNAIWRHKDAIAWTPHHPFTSASSCPCPARPMLASPTDGCGAQANGVQAIATTSAHWTTLVVRGPNVVHKIWWYTLVIIW